MMIKNVLKSQHIGEGMISVRNGQNLCWSHREREAIAILPDEQLALFEKCVQCRLFIIFIVDFGM